MKHKILLVDDEPANLRMLERLFRDKYDVVTSESGVEAVELLMQHDVAVIISDQRMPGMTGIEFLKKAAQLRRQTVRMILTGYTDIDDLVDAINSGVIYKYITKPWVNSDLLQTVHRAIEHYETVKRQHQLANENERLKSKLHVTVGAFVEGLGEMLAHRDPSLAEHCLRTSNYAALIGQEFDLDGDDIRRLTVAGLLHEVPHTKHTIELGFGAAELTARQHRLMRADYENGLGLITAVPDLEEVALIIRYQHEHYDGTGCFDGLESNQIPLLSRILAVANTFDEISSGRNPKLLRTDEQAVALLKERAGNQFDPRVVEVFLRTGLVGPIVPRIPREAASPVGRASPVEFNI